MTAPRTNTIGETISAHDGHEDLPRDPTAEDAQEGAAVRAPVAVATSDAERAAPSLTYRHNVLNGIADWLANRSRTAWASQFGYSGLMLSWSNDLREIDADLSSAAKSLNLPIDFKQATDQGGWQPLSTAPDGVRVLLGPREAPVVGIVRQMPEWADEQEPVASVIHYNGTVLVAGYHCSEWHALPDGEEAHCKNCDGTGDVHSFDGEWRGVCHCLAGKALKTHSTAPTLLGVADGDAVGGKSGGGA